MKIHIGPGSNWYSYCNKNNIIDWKTIDIDPKRGNFTVNFNKNFNKLPFKSDSIDAMYASHIFEHISVYVTPILFKECYRVLKKGGYLRIITPNPLISMKEYLNNNTDFPLFKRRKQRNPQFTLFECLRQDFISKNGQQRLLGQELAHQNAWDAETMIKDFIRGGFKKENVYESSFKSSTSDMFNFEGEYKSEANEFYRSLYVEGFK